MRSAEAAKDARAGRPPSLDELTTRKAELEAEHAENEQKIAASFEEEAAAVDEAIMQRVPAYSEAGGPAAKVKRKREALETRNANIGRELAGLENRVQEAARAEAEVRLADGRKKAAAIRQKEKRVWENANELFQALLAVYHSEYVPVVEEFDQLDAKMRAEFGSLVEKSEDWQAAITPLVVPVPMDVGVFVKMLLQAALDRDNSGYSLAETHTGTQGLAELVSDARSLVTRPALSGRVPRRESARDPSLVIEQVGAPFVRGAGITGG